MHFVFFGSSFDPQMFLMLASGQNRQKNSLKERAFVNSALNIQCHIVKITPTDCFSGDFAHRVGDNESNLVSAT